jgi:hypothetical protein
MTRRRRSPRPLEAALEAGRERWAPASLLGEVQARWAEAVGPAIAARSTPVAERSGSVTIACAGAVWAQELDLMSSAILERLDGLLGPGRVTRLRCVSTPAHSGR